MEKKKLLTAIFLSCLMVLPPAAMAQNDPDPSLVTKAEQGDTSAQKKLGDFYFSKKDNVNGLKWLKSSADGGNADAQNSLGFRYQRGNGVTKDVEAARKGYRMAAGAGLGAAKANLCGSFAETLNIERGTANASAPISTTTGSTADVDEAFRWCGVAAENGDKMSQYRLGSF